MSPCVQQSPALPTTLHQWERRLTCALLFADGDSDAIRSFEITPETLATHCGLSMEHGKNAEEAFRKALLADPDLIKCLEKGTSKATNDEVPNCIAMLALTLLVDSLLDGYKNKGQYRTKLSDWLGVERSFTNLSGVEKMWKQLVAWLDGRISAGRPFRWRVE